MSAIVVTLNFPTTSVYLHVIATMRNFL